MKTLILVRHAKSSWDDSSQDDHARPLNARGLSDAPQMAARLALRVPRPDGIVSSTAVRAHATAHAFAAALEIKEPALMFNTRLYLAHAHTALSLIADFPDAWRTAMYVGHNNGITHLARDIFGAPIEHMPTCSVVRLWWDVPRWRDVMEAPPVRGDFDWPKNDSGQPLAWP